jgi:hypothetical protein
LVASCDEADAAGAGARRANLRRVRETFLHDASGRGLTIMSKLLRGLAAGYGAKKLGGGCFSTILIFILLWWLLGHFRLFQ